jgi:hypothetical protein
MVASTKKMGSLTGDQVLSYSYNETGAICTEGWVTGMIGRKVAFSFGTTNVLNDTQLITYIELGVTLLTLANVYSDGTRSLLLYTERVS